jgi:hypothetical protein
MARRPNNRPTKTITVSTTPGVVEYLLRLVATDLYGKNPAEAAERLITRGIESLIKDGILKRGGRQGEGPHEQQP